MGSVLSGVGSSIGSLGGLNQGLAQGMGALSNYQASAPDIQRQNFAQAIAQSQQGFDASQGNQAQLAQALQAQMNGEGPNPAQAQLSQTTNQNMQNASGMVASQKGINPALAARMASENMGNINQQAAGQAATMRAQQQLGTQGQLGSLYGQMGQQNMGMQQIQQAGQAAQNQSITQGSLGAQAINAKTALQNAIQQGDISSSMLNNASSMMGGGMGGGGGGMGGMGGMSGMMGGMGAAHGGVVPKMSSGGMFEVSTIGNKQDSGGDSSGGDSGSGGGSGMSSIMSLAPLLAMAAAQGGKIPGKAEVPGDSQKNDKVHVMLSPGEIVVPRSKSGNAEKAKEFIDSLMKENGKSNGNDSDYGKVLAAHKKLHDRVKALESRAA